MSALNLTNHFLIAMPTLMDPNFYQTVTYICAHNDDGAMGIVINRPMDIPLGEVLTQMQIEATEDRYNQLPVYQGGPVQRDRGFIIYRPVGRWDSSILVADDVGLATSRDILEAISRGEGPKESLIALGYAGWGAGQLEQEMAENAWLSGPADQDILFRTPSERRWHSAAALLGVDLVNISHDVGHA